MKVAFTLNGRTATWSGPPLTRLATALRQDLGLTGTKVGCDAGDCGACTVLLDDRQVCACLIAMGQVEGVRIETVEGLAIDGLGALQQSFLDHGAAQCLELPECLAQVFVGVDLFVAAAGLRVCNTIDAVPENVGVGGR